MPIHRLGSRYSRWDGTQQISPLDADELMRAMSDDLMQDGDLNRALQRLFRWGFERPDGEQVPGLRELMQRLKERRQEQLSRYDLGSVLDDIKERLEQIVATERAGIERRLDEAAGGTRGAEEDAPTPRGGDGNESGRRQSAEAGRSGEGDGQGGDAQRQADRRQQASQTGQQQGGQTGDRSAGGEAAGGEG